MSLTRITDCNVTRRSLLLGVLLGGLAGMSAYGQKSTLDQLLEERQRESAQNRRTEIIIIPQSGPAQEAILYDELIIGHWSSNLLLDITNTATNDVGQRLFGLRAGQRMPGASFAASGSPSAGAMAGTDGASASGPMLASTTSGARTMSDLGSTLYLGTETMAGESTYAAGGIDNSKYMLIDSKSMVVNDKEMAFGPDYRFRAYVQGDFGFADVDSPLGSAGYDADTYVATAGLEYWFTDWLRAGVAAGYVTNSTDFDSSLASVDLDGYQLSAYTSMVFGGFYTDLLYSYGAQSQDITRNSFFGGSAAANNVGSHTHTAALNVGYNFFIPCGGPGEDLVTGPYARLQYTHGEVNGYTETGSSVALLSYPSISFDSLESRVGWQASKAWRVSECLAIIPQVRAAWGHQALNDTQNFTANFATVPGLATTASTFAPGRNWMDAGGGVEFAIGDQWSVIADYTAEVFRTDAFVQYVSLNASFSF